MKPIIWAHADCLTRLAPPFRHFPRAASVFVLDPEQFETSDWALKRILFLYEAATDLGCEIRRGDTTSELLWAARASGCDTIVTTESADPAFQRVCEELRKSVNVQVLPATAEPGSTGEIDVRQFFGYWKKSDSNYCPSV